MSTFYNEFRPGVIQRQYIGQHPAPAIIPPEELAARIAVEQARESLDGIPCIPASLLRSEAELNRVAAEIGTNERQEIISKSACGNFKFLQNRQVRKSRAKGGA